MKFLESYLSCLYLEISGESIDQLFCHAELTRYRIFLGSLTKGPAGLLGPYDQDRIRRAIIEKVPPPPGVCTRCGTKPPVPENTQKTVAGAVLGHPIPFR